MTSFLTDFTDVYLTAESEVFKVLIISTNTQGKVDEGYAHLSGVGCGDGPLN